MAFLSRFDNCRNGGIGTVPKGAPGAEAGAGASAGTTSVDAGVAPALALTNGTGRTAGATDGDRRNNLATIPIASKIPPPTIINSRRKSPTNKNNV